MFVLNVVKDKIFLPVMNMLSSTVKRYIRDPVNTYFGVLKIQVKF